MKDVLPYLFNEMYIEGYIEGYVDIFRLNEGVCFDHTKDLYTYLYITTDHVLHMLCHATVLYTGHVITPVGSDSILDRGKWVMYYNV